MSTPEIGNVRIINSNCTYNWIISNFCETGEMEPGVQLRSPEFTTEGDGRSYKWRLHLYPQGIDKKSEGFLTISLVSYNDCEISAQFSLCIVDNQGYDFCKEESKVRVFKTSGKEISWGWTQFIRRDEIIKNAIDTLKNGKLTIECVISTGSSRGSESKLKSGAIRKADEASQPNDDVQMPKPIPKVVDDFGKLFDNQKFSDVKFIVGDKTIHAHKIILSSRSPVFSAMFENEMEEDKKNEVIITDNRYDVFKSLLQYIYCGEVDEIENVATELMSVADKYQVDNLKSVIEMGLIEKLSVENALQIYNIADLHGVEKLKEETKSFMMKHAKEIVENPEFKTILQLHGDIVTEVMKTLVLQQS